MNILKVLFTGGVAAMLSAQLHAEVLVYRVRATSYVREGDSGSSSSSPMAAPHAYLAFIDLDTDYWTTSIGDLDIEINDSPSNKSFYSEASGSSGYSKFGFYAKGTKYYMFGADWGHPETLSSGLIRVNTDHGAFQTQGTCRMNVDIGTKKSPVPNDTVVTVLRGDAGTMTKGVFSLKFDSTITRAANVYLKSKGIRSSQSGVSTSVPAVSSWLVSTYLPKYFPGKFPYNN